MPAKKEYDGEAILDIVMDDQDPDSLTIREWLKDMLYELWTQQDSFDGKFIFDRGEIAGEANAPLVREGIIGGVFEDGELYDVDSSERDAAIIAAIGAM